MTTGSVVKLHGKVLAIVTSVHSGGKKLGVKYLDGSGKATFTNARNVTLASDADLLADLNAMVTA